MPPILKKDAFILFAHEWEHSKVEEKKIKKIEAKESTNGKMLVDKGEKKSVYIALKKIRLEDKLIECEITESNEFHFHKNCL